MTTSKSAIIENIMNNCLSVQAKEIKGGYQYSAVMSSGEKLVLRKKATRLYENAFFYSEQPSSGSNDLLANSFSYGKKPITQSYAGDLLKTFKVELKNDSDLGEFEGFDFEPMSQKDQDENMQKEIEAIKASN